MWVFFHLNFLVCVCVKAKTVREWFYLLCMCVFVHVFTVLTILGSKNVQVLSIVFIVIVFIILDSTVLKILGAFIVCLSLV